MNRLLITEVGDTIRLELKKELESTKHKTEQVTLKLPEIQNKSIQKSLLFAENDRFENPLYQKSLSEIAMNNLTRAASLSLLGVQSQKQLETHIRFDLNLPLKYQYLNQNLSKFVKNIVHDDDLQTKRKRQLLRELSRLQKCKTQDGAQQNEVSQFSSHIEESDMSRKLMEIINAEGKLEQLHRRYQKKEIMDHKQKQSIAHAIDKLNEKKTNYVDAINPMSSEQFQQNTNQYFKNYDSDKSYKRYHDRMKEKQQKQLVPVWNSNHIPNQTNRWKDWIGKAKEKKSLQENQP